MGYTYVKMLCPQYKYGIKCPYVMTPEGITVHNTASDASARAEISYMITNNKETSYHLAVDDIEVVQGLPFDRNGWHAGDGNGKGNRRTIGIEICYSKSGGERFDKAEDNAAILIASLLKERGWGIGHVYKHQDWSGKYCPHRTLDRGWNRFLDKIRAALGEAPATPDVEPQPSENRVDVIYRVKCTMYGWLPAVKNLSDYAGVTSCPITGIAIKGDPSLRYRVHLVRGGWLPYVSGYDINDYNNGYAGNGKTSIDGIEIISDNFTYKYRVDPTSRNSYYPWQYNNQTSNGQDGYAGVFGKAIDRVQISQA